MALVAEKDLVVGVEYFLDRAKNRKGLFTKREGGFVYFKKTAGDNYYVLNQNGEVYFPEEEYMYETV